MQPTPPAAHPFAASLFASPCQPFESPFTTPGGSKTGSSTTLHPAQVSMAQELYTLFQSLVNDHQKTKKLAKSIAKKTKENHKSTRIYKIKYYNHSIPYKIKRVEKALKMDLSDIFLHMFKQATYISLIFKRNYKLYIRQRTKEKSFDIFEVSKNITQINAIPDDNSKLKKGYLIFISHSETYTFKPISQPILDNEQRYYKYYSISKQSIESRQAPFHHEVQLNNLCGLHALNSYIGCRYLTPERISQYHSRWRRFRDGKSSDKSSGKSSGKSSDSDKSSEKLNGFDPSFLKFVLDCITRSVKKHRIVTIDSQPDFLKRRNLLLDLKNIDRFILGVSGMDRGHGLAFRKDGNGVWWRIDSLRNEQRSFANDHELLDEIYEDEANKLLHFIIPDGPVTIQVD